MKDVCGRNKNTGEWGVEDGGRENTSKFKREDRKVSEHVTWNQSTSNKKEEAEKEKQTKTMSPFLLN